MGISPSRSLRITPWASNLIGMRDCWTARNFDNAVMAFGIYGDNFLAERDEDGNQVHTINELLEIEPDEEVKLHNNTTQAQMMKLLTGGTV